MEGISEATGMSLESIEEDARIMEKQGLLEKICSDGVLAPTSRGLEMIYENVRRQMEITAFLTDTLGLEEIEAQSNAWKWKFLLSDEAMKAIRDFLLRTALLRSRGKLFFSGGDFSCRSYSCRSYSCLPRSCFRIPEIKSPSVKKGSVP